MTKRPQILARPLVFEGVYDGLSLVLEVAMKVSLFFVRIYIFTCFATVLRTADFVALEKTTTLEAHKLQPFHLPLSSFHFVNSLHYNRKSTVMPLAQFDYENCHIYFWSNRFLYCMQKLTNMCTKTVKS